jgi:hypothetical protein
MGPGTSFIRLSSGYVSSTHRKEQTMKKILTIVAAILILGGLAGGLTAAFAFDRPSGNADAPFASGMCIEDEPDCIDTLVSGDDEEPTLENPDSQRSMTADEAKAIAEASRCVSDGAGIGDARYNEHTGTWWFDLDIEKEGCSPACVVNEATGQAEINWRCTGVLPPVDDTVQGVPDTSGPCLEGEPNCNDTPVFDGGNAVGMPIVGSTDGQVLPNDSEISCELPTVDPMDPVNLERPQYPDGIMIPDPGKTHEGNTPDDTAPNLSVLAPIEGIEVLVMESYPPQYAVKVTSGLPNSCASFEKYDVRRNGDTIDIKIYNTVPEPVEFIACAEIYGLVETHVSLGSDFVPGETYTVLVNGAPETFVAQ